MTYDIGRRGVDLPGSCLPPLGPEILDSGWPLRPQASNAEPYDRNNGRL